MQPVIKQLEKALKAKDEQELRTRIEVLLDFLKDNEMPTRPMQPMPQPVQPMPQEDRAARKTQGNITATPQVKGVGAIVGGEELQLKRPAGT